MLVECLNLLWNLVEASPVALAIFNQMGFISILLPLLSQETEPTLGKWNCIFSDEKFL